MYWVVVFFGPHSGLVWTSTIVRWGGLIWLIGVIDVLTSTVTQLSMYLMHSNFRLLWNVKCTNASEYGEYMSVVHCTLYNVHIEIYIYIGYMLPTITSISHIRSHQSQYINHINLSYQKPSRSMHQSHQSVISETTGVNTSITSISDIRNHLGQYVNHINLS